MEAAVIMSHGLRAVVFAFLFALIVCRTGLAQTDSLWSVETTPVTITNPDPNSVELGVKFASSVNGTISAIRFYKGVQNTGQHTVSLWSSAGTRLATASSTNETASGWQTVKLSAPIAITAGTTYVASYHASGHYSHDQNYFAFAYSNGVLSAPRNAGVYAYGGPSQFPRSTWNDSNYWVDIVFNASPGSSVNGECGPASSIAGSTAPTSGQCTRGSVSAISGSGPWNWTCGGLNGGTTAICSAPAKNGQCGPANGAAVSTAPTSGLCTTGTASALSGSGPWHWNCYGSNSGSTCSASLSSASGGLLPADRDASANWRMAGLQSLGGIPNRTTVCAALSPRGGGADDTANIQNAINSCPTGQVVSLSAGTFTIAAGSYVLINNAITLRGAGAGSTILQHPGPAQGSSPLVILGPARYGIEGAGHATALSADAAQGSFTITLSCGGNCNRTFQAGMMVQLDELSGAVYQTDPVWPTMQVLSSPDWRVVYHVHNPPCCGDDTGIQSSGTYDAVDRPVNEIKRIASVSGNNVTFDSPVMIAYRVSHTARLSRFEDGSGNVYPPQQNAGVENLSFLYGDDGAINFTLCEYCWAKNTENSVWQGQGIHFVASFRDEVDEFYSHDAYNPQPTSGAYAIALDWASSEILLQDGISITTNKVMVARAAGAGSVVAYNYMDMAMIDYVPAWQEIELNASHFAGPHHVLFEGNYAPNADADYTHGNATNMTYFRNWLRGVRHRFVNTWACSPGCTGRYTGKTFDDQAQGNGPARAAGPQGYHYWYTFIGNVLGASGQMSGWRYSCDLTSGPCEWALGWGVSNASGTWGTDPQETTLSFPGHVLREGNWDWVNAAQRWEDGSTAMTIPNSLYLSSAPSFFGGAAWPWVDPTSGSAPAKGLPSKARFDAGKPNCNC
jgi:Domain of unknown function (DUF4082)